MQYCNQVCHAVSTAYNQHHHHRAAKKSAAATSFSKRSKNICAEWTCAFRSSAHRGNSKVAQAFKWDHTTRYFTPSTMCVFATALAPALCSLFSLSQFLFLFQLHDIFNSKRVTSCSHWIICIAHTAQLYTYSRHAVSPTFHLLTYTYSYVYAKTSTYNFAMHRSFAISASTCEKSAAKKV